MASALPALYEYGLQLENEKGDDLTPSETQDSTAAVMEILEGGSTEKNEDTDELKKIQEEIDQETKS